MVSRQLRFSLLVSSLLHLFCFAFISVVFLPRGFSLNSPTRVDFLGSILAGNIYKSELGEPKQAVFKVPAEAQINTTGFFSSVPAVLPDLEKQSMDYDQFINIDSVPLPAPFLNDTELPADSGEREVIFKPDLPEYPEWSGSQEVNSGLAVFDVYISSAGLIEQLLCVQSSGNPQLDAALTRYIRKWRFAPVDKEQNARQSIEIDLNMQ